MLFKRDKKKENIMYAAIHLDESTPHMHIYFTPVVNEVKRKVFELDKKGHQLKKVRKEFFLCMIY